MFCIYYLISFSQTLEAGATIVTLQMQTLRGSKKLRNYHVVVKLVNDISGYKLRIMVPKYKHFQL